MNSDDQMKKTNARWGLCERKMNPTVRIYDDNAHLCSTCLHRLQNLPEIVAKSIERFLVGNVV